MVRLAIIESKKLTAAQQRRGKQREIVEVELSELTDIGLQQIDYEAQLLREKIDEIHNTVEDDE